MQASHAEIWHGTTILTVRKGGKVVIGGDGQVRASEVVTAQTEAAWQTAILPGSRFAALRDAWLQVPPKSPSWGAM